MRSVYRLYQIAQWLSERLPQDLCLWLAERLADAHCSRAFRDRAAVQANLTHVLKTAVAQDAPEVREVFRHFGRYLAEFLSAHRLPHAAIRVQGCEQVVKTLERHRAGIVLSAHVGNWELGAILLCHLGFPISVVALPHNDTRVNRLFDAQRLRCGVGIIPLGAEATPRSLEWLNGGRWLGILGDREFGPSGIAVSFFGRTALVPRGPAVLSLRTGAPVIPIGLIREGPWHFRFCLESPIWPPAGLEVAAQIAQLAQRYATAIERLIRQTPTQWLMFQAMFGSAQASMPRDTVRPGEVRRGLTLRESEPITS